MTETALSEVLIQIELQRLELTPAQSSWRTGRNYRRQMDVRKNDRLLRIVTRHYVPHAGYIDWGFDGNPLVLPVNRIPFKPHYFTVAASCYQQ